MRRLSDLGLHAAHGGDPGITGLSVDSRGVRQGHLFAALPGTRMHGAEFANYAMRQGAAAILTDPSGARLAEEALKGRTGALVVTEDPRQALAYAAALWFGGQPETVVAVTGTNGKTSVATFARQLWEALGHRACNMGTTGVEGAWEAPSSHTTPEPVTLHRLLAEMADEGVTHLAMEASSHGLAQSRLDGVALGAAGFTNLSQDHLDYHDDFEDYFAAKAGLFDRVLPEDGTAVIDIDGDYGLRMLGVARDRGQDVITVGETEGADIRILGRRYDETGQDLRFDLRGAVHQTRLTLIGGFQASNALLALGLVMATGTEAGEAISVLPKLETAKGRMQLVGSRPSGGSVFVDYAHTPEAVATALAALRPHVMGRIVCVLGAGGDRDTGKRPLMGRAAAEGADMVIVTDDNPRSEDPATIRAAVLEGARAAGGDVSESGDRAAAILLGVDAIGPGDALLIAGKGHETGQEVGGTTYPFDDAEQASIAMQALDL